MFKQYYEIKNLFYNFYDILAQDDWSDSFIY